MENNASPDLPSIIDIETAVPAFIGYTQKAERNGTGCTLLPVYIDSMDMYEKYFGWPEFEQNLEVLFSAQASTGTAIQVQFAAGKTACLYNMYYALKLFFENGGKKCYIVSVGASSSAGAIDPLLLAKGLAAIQNKKGVTLVAMPEAVEGLTGPAYGDIITAILQQCSDLQDRFAILDVKTIAGKTVAENAAAFRNNLQKIKAGLNYSAAYFPYLKTGMQYRFKDVDISIVDKRGSSINTTNLEQLNKADGALYNQVKTALDDFKIVMPPSPAIAGIYALVDAATGVWKSPANVGLQNISGVSQNIAPGEQEDLNIHMSGFSINAIRVLVGNGVLVWGARTLDGNSLDWRYVSVRRFCIMLENTISIALEALGSEANESTTWLLVKNIIENYLLKLWQQGALKGSTAAEAFQVSIGLGNTMTPADIEAGIMKICILAAVSRPAEFIELTFAQKMQRPA